jgi:hypothetical protein
MKITIESTTERLENVGGMLVAGEISRASGLSNISCSRATTASALNCLFGLLVQGRTAFEDIELYRNNDLFKNALGLPMVFAPETVRLYLEELAKECKTLLPQLRLVNENLLAKTTLTPVAVGSRKYLPVDTDVSPMDNSRTKKEGVSRTYKGYDGFAPIFSYIGAEGYMLDCELRPGSQHCQKDTPAFMARNLEAIARLKPQHPVVFRLDGGNDSFDTIKPLVVSGHFFVIKRNMRRDKPQWWVDMAQSIGERTDPRPGKTQWTGVLTKTHPKADEDFADLDVVFQVTERTADYDGTKLLFPEVEVETWWTNLFEEPGAVINLYHDHGTSEQFHSELKSDMGVERLPSGKMAVNAIVLTMAMFAFNTLRFMGQTALANSNLLPVKPDGERKRLRKVITDLIFIACKFVTHAGKKIIRVYNKNPWLPVFQKLYATAQAM